MDSTQAGKRIARIRESLRWTQAELAERVGVTSTTIAAYEQGRRAKLDTLQQIAEALGVPLTHLVEGTPGAGGDAREHLERLSPLLSRMSNDARDEIVRLARLIAGV